MDSLKIGNRLETLAFENLNPFSLNIILNLLKCLKNTFFFFYMIVFQIGKVIIALAEF